MTATAPAPRITRTNGIAASKDTGETRAESRVGKLATYWLALAGVYLMQGALWYYGAYEKIIGGDLEAPAGISKGFAGTFVDTFPGVGVAWGVISIAEALLVVGLAASLIRGEFLPGRAKPILMATLGGSVVVLGMLLFGQSMIGEHESVASLFTYGGVTFIMMGVVAALAPGGRFWSRES
jgi:hypothetical protein